MVMAFMERLALFLISISSFVILISGCAQPKPRVVDSDTVAFVTKHGITYCEGIPFSGIRVKMFSSKDTAFIARYVDGREEGWSRTWYDNAQLREQRYFKEGRKEGTHQGWYENGILSFEASYKNDAYHGNVREWDETGNLYRDFNYINGQEEGMQRMWESDGRLKANYVARNGRKYGLAGAKNCVSLTSDIK